SIRGPATIPRSNRSSGASPDTPLSAVGQTPSDLRVYPWGPIWGSLHTISISEVMLRGVGGCTTHKGCTGTEGLHVRVNPSTGALAPCTPLRVDSPLTGASAPCTPLRVDSPLTGALAPCTPLRVDSPLTGALAPCTPLRV